LIGTPAYILPPLSTLFSDLMNKMLQKSVKLAHENKQTKENQKSGLSSTLSPRTKAINDSLFPDVFTESDSSIYSHFTKHLSSASSQLYNADADFFPPSQSSIKRKLVEPETKVVSKSELSRPPTQSETKSSKKSKGKSRGQEQVESATKTPKKSKKSKRP